MLQKNYKHLTLEQRIEIQACLSHGVSFKDIAKRIGVCQTTVSREVKRHIVIRQTSVTRTNKDGNVVLEPCKLLLKAPFVCNPCKHCHRVCSFDKRLYSAKDAQRAYEALIVEAREGIPLAKETFYDNDRIITDGVRKGQHIYHILKTRKLAVSVATVYRHLKKGYLSVNACELPRVVKFKPRSAPYSPYIPAAAKVGRTYLDFLLLKEQADFSSWIEMDTLIGRVGGKVILTLHFTFCNFMIGFLLNDKSAASVSSAIVTLKKLLTDNGFSFGKVFTVILTDNGGEFSNISAIENDLSGKQETRLFFCDPAKSSQKPHVEKNHTLFRDIVPQGTSFDNFTQDTINLVFSHVNSVKRKLFCEKTPFELFAFAYGDSIARLLGIDSIPAEHVLQSPKLLKI
jgi:IS30 family transposase